MTGRLVLTRSAKRGAELAHAIVRSAKKGTLVNRYIRNIWLFAKDFSHIWHTLQLKNHLHRTHVYETDNSIFQQHFQFSFATEFFLSMFDVFAQCNCSFQINFNLHPELFAIEADAYQLAEHKPRQLLSCCSNVWKTKQALNSWTRHRHKFLCKRCFFLYFVFVCVCVWGSWERVADAPK